MFKLGSRRTRNLAAGVLSTFCFSLSQQCILADDFDDMNELREFLSSYLSMTTLNKDEGNTYSIGKTAKKILENLAKPGENTFAKWASDSYSSIFDGNCNKKCKNNCWTSSFAVIELVHNWHKYSETKPKFCYGLASHALFATLDKVNHTMVYIILGDCIMLCDALWGRISEIVGFGEKHEVLWKWFYGFYHNISVEQIEIKSTEQTEDTGYSNKKFNIFNGIKDAAKNVGNVVKNIGNVKNIIGANPNNANKGGTIFLSEDFERNMYKSLSDLKWKEAESAISDYSSSGKWENFSDKAPGMIFGILK